MAEEKRPGTGGNRYVPYAQRTGNESVVYFTRDLSPEGISKAYEQVCGNIRGRVALKLHTGEKNGPNIIPAAWVQKFMEKDLPGATIVETNTFYEGDRYTTELHRETLRVNGWADFTTVDITDEFGTTAFPVKGGKWFTEMYVGKSLPDYDSLVVLTHFKGHTMGGFGGSNKNIGIGCADGRIGKAMIHQRPGLGQWSIAEEEFMERICESAKSVVDHFGRQITFVNVLRNISVDCDCAGVQADPVVTPNIGILASTDMLAVDQASVDLIHSLGEKDRVAMLQRMSSRHGYRQLSYMKELGMGNDRYVLVDLDNGGARITAKEAAAAAKPFAG